MSTYKYRKKQKKLLAENERSARGILLEFVANKNLQDPVHQDIEWLYPVYAHDLQDPFKESTQIEGMATAARLVVNYLGNGHAFVPDHGMHKGLPMAIKDLEHQDLETALEIYLRQAQPLKAHMLKSSLHYIKKYWDIPADSHPPQLKTYMQQLMDNSLAEDRRIRLKQNLPSAVVGMKMF